MPGLLYSPYSSGGWCDTAVFGIHIGGIGRCFGQGGWNQRLLSGQSIFHAKCGKKYLDPFFSYEEQALIEFYYIHFIHHEHHYTRWPCMVAACFGFVAPGRNDTHQGLKNYVCLLKDVSIRLCIFPLSFCFSLKLTWRNRQRNASIDREQPWEGIKHVEDKTKEQQRRLGKLCWHDNLYIH